MQLEVGDQAERDGETLYIVGFRKGASVYDTEDGADWGDVEVTLCREWDEYGAMPPFWSEKLDDFLESVDDVE